MIDFFSHPATHHGYEYIKLPPISPTKSPSKNSPSKVYKVEEKVSPHKKDIPCNICSHKMKKIFAKVSFDYKTQYVCSQTCLDNHTKLYIMDQREKSKFDRLSQNEFKKITRGELK